MIRSGRVAFHDDLEPMMYPIDSAQTHPENDNDGDMEAIDHSVEENGMYGPIKVQKSTGYIVAGNHTWLTVKARGAEICPMVWLDVDDTTARRILLDDNHTSRLARKHSDQTLALLDKIREAEGSTAHTTYTEYDVAVLEEMAKMPLQFDHATWPTFQVQLPPHVLKAFYYMTREADNDRDRVEVLLRLAGWQGKEPLL